MRRSRVSAEPVAVGLVGLKGLLAELLVAAGLHGVHLKTVRICVHEVVLGEHVGHWVESGHNAQRHHENDFGVWHLGATQVADVLGDVVGHLWCR